MKYKVVSECNNNEVWAIGFYGNLGKVKAEKRIKDGYFHKYMYDTDKNKRLVVVEDN